MPSSNMTYDSLVTDVQAYSERPDDIKLLNQLPRIVMLAENHIATDLKNLGIRKVAISNLQVGNNVVDKPAFWRKTTSIGINVDGKRTPVFQRAYEYCRTYAPDESMTGQPRFYADYDFNHIFIVPTPDAAYTFEMAYEAKSDPLTDENQVNWMTYNAPQLLFNCTMRETARYLKQSDKVQEWDTAYQQSLQGFGKEDTSRVSDNSSVLQ